MGIFTTSKQFTLGLNLTGQWWLSGASIDLDFDNGRYYDSSLSALKQPLAAASDYLSCTRASTGYAKNSAGSWVGFTNNQLRLTDLGLLIEEARTNYLLNSETPATQTTASLSTGSYTLWVEGSGSALASGGTATITGAASATQGSPDTFTVTVAGTVVVTVTGSLARFQLEAGGFALSYIPTGGATATRAADNIGITGAFATLLSGSAGSVVLQRNRGVDPSAGSVLALLRDQGNSKNLFYANAAASYTSDDAADSLSTANGPNGTTRDKGGLAWNSSGRSLVLNAGTVATSANALTQVGPFSLGLTSIDFDAYVERFTIWNSRLADATLQALTTLP